MQYIINVAFVTVLILFTSISLAEGLSINIGIQHKLEFSAADKMVDIQVYLPFQDPHLVNKLKSEGKDITKNNIYPVLYVLDGQDWFLNAISISRILAQYQEIPPLIIVGISSSNLNRHQSFSEKSQLADFIEQKLIPFVDEQYPINGQKMLFGWQYAGSFSLALMGANPGLFNNFIVASPFPVEGDNLSNVELALESWESDDRASAVQLHFAANQTEGTVKSGTDKLATLLRNKAPVNLLWNYSVISPLKSVSQGHRFSPIDALYHGLVNYFEGYTHIELPSLVELNEKGGIEYVKDYYRERSKKYGFSPEVHSDGWFYLTRLAINEDSPKALSLFVREMQALGQLDNLNTGWVSTFGKFFVKHKDWPQAINIYTSLSKRLPNEPMIFKRLGDIYYKQNLKDKARENYKKAIALAIEHSPEKLEQFRQDLESVK